MKCDSVFGHMSTTKLHIPDINSYSQFRPFLVDFIKKNKQANAKFSLRFFANKLGWSPSYLNDVCQGRRFASLKKVLELSDFLGLKGVRSERLLLLAVFESNGLENEKANQFLHTRNSSLNINTVTKQNEKTFTSVLLLQVFHYIYTRDGVWDTKDFLSRIRKPEISADEISQVLQKLEHDGLIRRHKNKYTIEKTDFYRDAGYPDELYDVAQKNFAKSYIDFIDDRYAPWTDLFGAVLIPQERLAEVMERMFSLRNFLYEIHSETLLTNPNAKFEYLQFGLHLFGVFRRDKDLVK